ncbi:MAG: cation diffusion facilitator family transporter [Azonexus sp.]|jgi:cation diffusion facilitator family transporter|uniref:cation diffusion facilitator family transporter n=1 Tax=Azonexus sp. TaxID=1872668 RepID=UPI002827294A|nr:cation diffusion facilitator family transporter [Azonexus sp.]MDR0777279.1 cation diffusion facilitator family transporter [Azonexus sp.]
MAQADRQAMQMTPAARAAVAQRATWVSVAVNLVMTAAQLVVGWLAHSQSLIAHGLHSFSDLLSDFLVIYASRKSAHPADPSHPYGHARIETAATLVLGVALILVGAGILWDSGIRLQHAEALPSIETIALWTAVATVLAKEGLYHYLIAVGRRLRSQLLIANALHTRADAASALVVVVGIGGALLGWGFLDLLAAALMGFMILRMGGQLAWGAIKELIDTGLDEASVVAIRQCLLATPGVLGVHDLRTRRMAHQALVDVHVLVDSRISVSEGHCIAETARIRVLAEQPDVLDVLVHIDPEADPATDPAVLAGLPGRATVLAELQELLAELPPPRRIVLHYLCGAIEVEVYVDLAHLTEALSLAQAEKALAERLAGHPAIRAIHLNACVAPS